MTELEQLKEELEKAENAEFMMSMSDNFCYSTGRIYPLKQRVKELREQIAELEKENSRSQRNGVDSARDRKRLGMNR